MAFENDRRLVACILAGDSGALAQFISDYRRFICAILTRHLNFSPPDADEIFQRFLFRVWENDFRRLRDWSGNTPLAAYLARIARNLAHDYRRETRFLSGDCPPERAVDDPGLMSVERQATLKSALLQLAPRDRELIYRRFFLEQSYDEIARSLDVAPNTIGVALSRAKDRLKKILHV
jgi:RNA polymerase sigma factor (sigma-70 family)